MGRSKNKRKNDQAEHGDDAKEPPASKLKYDAGAACSSGIRQAEQSGEKTQAEEKTTVIRANTGHLNEVVIGKYVLFKLLDMQDAYDFTFSMEDRQYGKFDDIVVGIQRKREDEMKLYTIQLKGCETAKSFGTGDLFPELVQSVGLSKKNKSSPFVLKDYYKEIGKGESKLERIRSVAAYVIYTQYTYTPPESSLNQLLESDPGLKEHLVSKLKLDISDLDAVADTIIMEFGGDIDREQAVLEAKRYRQAPKVLQLLSMEDTKREFKELLDVLPDHSSTSACFLKPNLKAIKDLLLPLPEWKENQFLSKDDFLGKVLIVASGKNFKEFHDEGLRKYPRWSSMTDKVIFFQQHLPNDAAGLKQGKPTDPISKRTLLNIQVGFQSNTAGNERQGLGAAKELSDDKKGNSPFHNISKDSADITSAPLPQMTRHGTIRIGDILERADSETLCRLIIDPTEICIGRRVRGLGAVGAYHLERTCVQQNEDGSVTLKNIDDMLQEKLVLIGGQPGMGKTTFMQHAAEHLQNAGGSKVHWVVEARFADLSSKFEKLDRKKKEKEEEKKGSIQSGGGEREGTKLKLTPQDVVEILTELAVPTAETENDRLSRSCFKGILKGNLENVSIGLFMDGLDEVDDKYYTTSLQLIKMLIGLKAINKVWISTREHHTRDAEEIRSTKCHTLKPFDAEDQKLFFKKFWNVCGNEMVQFEAFAESLRKELNCHSFSFEQLVGIPLLTMMVAEIYEDQYRRNAAEFDETSVLHIFEQFVKKKFQRQHKKYFRTEATEKNLNEFKKRENRFYISQHCLLGLLNIYDPNMIIFNQGHSDFSHGTSSVLLPILTKAEIEELQRAIKKVGEPGHFESGLIAPSHSRYSAPNFIHRVFAEYFAARYLFEKVAMLEDNEAKFRELSQEANAFQTLKTKLLPENVPDSSTGSLNQLVEIKAFLQRNIMDPNSEKVRAFFVQLAIRRISRGKKNLTKKRNRWESKKRDGDEVKPNGVLCLKPFHVQWMTGGDTLETLHGLTSYETSESLMQNDWTHILLPDLLKKACAYGSREVLHWAFDKGVVISSDLGRSRTLLGYASKYNHPEAVSILIARGADVNRYDNDHKTPLHYACEEGHIEVVKLLIEKGVDVNQSGWFQNSPLHCACAKGNLEVIRHLILKGADVNLTDNRNLLHLACNNGNCEVVKLLIGNNLDVNITDEFLMTPLHHACEKGHLEVVKLLIAKDAEVNTPDEQGKIPLHYACEEEYIEVIKLLLAKDAEVNTADEEGKMPLHYACEEGYIEVIRLLIEKGAKANTTDEEGKMPLHYACEEGFLEVVNFLIQNNADVNGIDLRKQTPLHYACESGCPKVVSLLIDNNAYVNGNDLFMKTPLHHASQKGCLEVVRYLIEKGANVNSTDINQKQPLHHACENGQLEVVSDLIEKGADLNKVDEYQRTPLHYACEKSSIGGFSHHKRNYADVNRHLEVIRLLLEKGADVNTTGSMWMTPLQYASEEGCLKVVSLLIQNNADVNTSIGQQGTPLHNACKGGHFKVANHLIEKGAEVNRTDEYQKTPLHLACEEGHLAVVKLLIERNAVVFRGDSFNRSPLYYALFKGHSAIAKLLTAMYVP